jgi:hypothetical protein
VVYPAWVTAVVVAGLLPVAVTATAAENDAAHCAARLEPAEGEPSATVVELGCFPTYAQALAAGSAGMIRVSAGETPASLTNADVESATDSSASSVLIGTEYNETGYIGTSKSYFADVTCSASVTWDVSYVGDTWNDRFESGKGFGGCDHNRKFAASQFGGSSVLCTPNCTSYGSLNNAVSSLRWKD